MAQMVQEIGEVGASRDGGDRSDVGRKAHDSPLRMSSSAIIAPNRSEM
jgi:hypothetical protein